MAQEVAGQRYAQALFELAVDRGQLEPWAEQLAFASQVVQDGEFSAFLAHAEVPWRPRPARWTPCCRTWTLWSGTWWPCW